MRKNLSTLKIDCIRQASRTIVRELGFMHEDLADSKLPASSVHALIELSLGSVSNATELKLLLGLEKSTISRLLKSLLQRGLVATATDPSDARLQNIVLTVAGHKKVTEIENFARQRLHRALHQEPTDAVDLITQGLQSYADALQASNTIESPYTVDYHTRYLPGLLGFIVGQHAQYYAKNYNFGVVFERKVASEMTEFLGRIENSRNAIFSATLNDQLVGSVSIDGQDLAENVAHLRWFIVDEDVQGKGVGRQLIDKAMCFVDHYGFEETQLWTFKGLDAARYLYEQAGFRLVEERKGAQWGTVVSEQRFVRV